MTGQVVVANKCLHHPLVTGPVKYTTSSLFASSQQKTFSSSTAVLPELLTSCQFTAVSLFCLKDYIKNTWKLVGFFWGGVGGGVKCACTSTELTAGKPYHTHTPSPSNKCFFPPTVTTSAAPRCYVQRSFRILYGLENNTKVQQKVRSGWATCVLFILTSPSSPHPEMPHLYMALFFIIFTAKIPKDESIKGRIAEEKHNQHQQLQQSQL